MPGEIAQQQPDGDLQLSSSGEEVQRMTRRTPGPVSNSSGIRLMYVGTGMGSSSCPSSPGRASVETVLYAPVSDRLTIMARLRLPMPSAARISFQSWQVRK